MQQSISSLQSSLGSLSAGSNQVQGQQQLTQLFQAHSQLQNIAQNPQVSQSLQQGGQSALQMAQGSVPLGQSSQ